MNGIVQNQETGSLKDLIVGTYLIGTSIYILIGAVGMASKMYSPGFAEYVYIVGWMGVIEPLWYLFILCINFIINEKAW